MIDMELIKCIAARKDSAVALSKEVVPRSAIDRIYTHPNSNEQEKDVLNKLEQFDGVQCTICADMCPLPNAFTAIGMIDDNINFLSIENKLSN